jgi:hypothetical protein
LRRRGAAAGKTLVRLAQRCQSAEELGEEIRKRYDRALRTGGPIARSTKGSANCWPNRRVDRVSSIASHLKGTGPPTDTCVKQDRGAALSDLHEGAEAALLPEK